MGNLLVNGRAEFSPCRNYRYTLERQWDLPGAPQRLCAFIMLNPSTADAETDDPTTRRCMAFARETGHDQYVAVNLFAYRAARPADMLAAEDPVGPQNDDWIGVFVSKAKARTVAPRAGSGGEVGVFKVLDLFSGIGGFSLGLERTGGFRTVAFCETDTYCRRVLAKHWPDIPIYGDVRELNGEQLRQDGIAADVITGGFPCQDISAAGPRTGIDGGRSGLWKEYARIIGEIQPQYALVENTADLTVRGLFRILGDLAEIGYAAAWHGIPAAAVGADHWRYRIWIMSYPNGTGVFEIHQRGGQQRAQKVGEDAAENVANDYRPRPQGRMQTGPLNEDARAISPWLGLALSSAPAFPGEYWSCKPVLGRGAHGIPHRVDRMHALGNTLIPEIPTVIGRAILAAEAEMRGAK